MTDELAELKARLEEAAEKSLKSGRVLPVDVGTVKALHDEVKFFIGCGRDAIAALEREQAERRALSDALRPLMHDVRSSKPGRCLAAFSIDAYHAARAAMKEGA